MRHPIAEIIQNSNDFIEVVNLISQKYSGKENVPDIALNTLSGILSIQRETQNQYVGVGEFERLVQRHIPKTSKNCPIHKEIIALKKEIDNSDTQVFPENKKMNTNKWCNSNDEYTFNSDNSGDTKVFNSDEYNW